MSIYFEDKPHELDPGGLKMLVHLLTCNEIYCKNVRENSGWSE